MSIAIAGKQMCLDLEFALRILFSYHILHFYIGKIADTRDHFLLVSIIFLSHMSNYTLLFMRLCPFSLMPDYSPLSKQQQQKYTS